MTNPYGKIYTILSGEWTAFLWSFEPVFIPQSFRENLVLVLGWTTGRRGYIHPTVPDGASPDHCIQIRCPRRRAVPNNNEITATLRKNKGFSALVESSYVRLDWVWEVPFAILLEVPRTGMQLMLRGASMEKIMRIYSVWGWDQAWGGTYGSRAASPQWGGRCQDLNKMEPPESIGQAGEVDDLQMMGQPCQSQNGLTSLGSMRKDGDAEAEAEAEAVAGSNRTGDLDLAYSPDDEEHGRSEERPSPGARQEMVYAGRAHCETLAKLLRDAQR